MEWTEDCYHDSYNGAPADGSAWTRGDCSFRVLRGGSWNYITGYLRSALRSGYLLRLPVQRHRLLGRPNASYPLNPYLGVQGEALAEYFEECTFGDCGGKPAN